MAKIGDIIVRNGKKYEAIPKDEYKKCAFYFDDNVNCNDIDCINVMYRKVKKVKNAK